MEKIKKTKHEDNLLLTLVYRYLPFWPIFLSLLITCLIAAWGYLQYATPIYQASATLIIKDEKKGVDDSKMMQSINAFDSKKIVENEIEVIQSREIMGRVVNDLYLYAPIFEESAMKDIPAYTTSPVVVKFKNPDAIRLNPDDQVKNYFIYDYATKEVKFEGKSHKLGSWIETAAGTMMFLTNERHKDLAKGKLYYSLINPFELGQGMLQRLDVRPTDKLSTVVKITYFDPVPQLAEDIINSLITSYNEKAISDRNSLAANTLKFIEDRMLVVTRDLAELEFQMVNYRSSSGAVDLSEQVKLYLRDLGDNDRRIADIKLQLDVLERVEDYVFSKTNEAGIAPSTGGINDPVLSQLLEKLYDAEIKHEGLKRTNEENNPIVISITNEIEMIRPRILENILNQKNNLSAVLSNLIATSGEYNSSLNGLPEKERALLEITRSKTEKSNLLNYLLQKREETALSFAPRPGDGRVVDIAGASKIPVSPKKKMIYAMAVIFAFGLGVSFIVAKEVLNRNVLFRAEIEQFTDIPIVAELAFLMESVKDEKEAVNMQQFRDLRLSLGLYGVTDNKKKIVVTSSIAGEGKSFVSEGLAINLSSAGKKVVILNFDLHKTENSKLYSSGKSRGIAGYLNSEVPVQELPEPTEHENLYSIRAGKLSPNVSNVLLDFNLDPLFDHLNASFDYIIIDTPPIAVATDALLIAKISDYTLFVVRHDYTPKDFLQNLEVNNNLAETKRLYIVFNGLKERGYLHGKYGYNYGYTQKSMAYNTYSCGKSKEMNVV